MPETLTRPRRAGRRDESAPHADDHRDRLGVVGGLAALSLDAMASVAYGPEAIVLVLALAGGAGLGLTLPVTLSIAVLLVVLTFSYRQVIAAFPEGGGAYGVAKTYLGKRASLLAASSLVVDYVLNVAVSVAAGVAALTSAFPELLPYTVWLCLGVLGIVTAVNLRGIAHSARLFIVPTVVYVGSIVTVIVVGLLRGNPAAAPLGEGASMVGLETVGILLILRAFANGCASLTGVEAIANAVPSFREPRVRKAQHAEVVLGILLGTMLLGIAALVEKFDVEPVEGVTVLAQVTNASLGHGIAFYVVQFITVILLGLAANTSFGGLPVLMRLMARDNYLPHVFALRADHQVYRYGVIVLSAVSAVLLVAAQGNMNALVPLFAIGVFVGFTLAQTGMVRHWLTLRSDGWRKKAMLNGVGAALTGVAAVVVTLTKFTEGAWLIVVALPALMLTAEIVQRRYTAMGTRLEIGTRPPAPRPTKSVVVVPVAGVNRLTQAALSSAMSLGDRVVAIHVVHPDADVEPAEFLRAWDDWAPNVPLTIVYDEHRQLAEPLVAHLRRYENERVVVLIPELEPAHVWERILLNQRGAVLAHALRRDTDAIICRFRFRVEDLESRSMRR